MKKEIAERAALRRDERPIGPGNIKRLIEGGHIYKMFGGSRTKEKAERAARLVNQKGDKVAIARHFNPDRFKYSPDIWQVWWRKVDKDDLSQPQRLTEIPTSKDKLRRDQRNWFSNRRFRISPRTPRIPK